VMKIDEEMIDHFNTIRDKVGISISLQIHILERGYIIREITNGTDNL